MNFNDVILKKAMTSSVSQGTFGSLTASTKEQIQNLSLFNSASYKDIENLDIEKLLSAENIESVVGEDATTDQKALAQVLKSFLDIDSIKEVADLDNSGEIEQEEALEFLKKAMGFDGNLDDLSMDDLDALVEKMNIDLSSDLDKLLDEVEKDSVDDVDKTSTTPSSSTGGSSSGYSPSVGNSSNGTSSVSKNNNGTTEQADTPEGIRSQIDEKNAEIEEIESNTEKEIEEQEKLKEKAMKDAGVSEEEYEAYKEKQEEVGKQITEKETAIKEKEGIISDKQSTISSNESYISSIEAQISANESKLSSIAEDDENAASKKQEINDKISNLKTEKSQKEEENSKLEEEIKTAEKEKAEIEQEKQELEQEKQQLLTDSLNTSEGFAKGILDSSSVAKIKENITNFDSKISEIKSNAQQEIATKNSEIQELQVKLKDAEAAEERTDFLKENSFKAGLGLTGEELVDVAKQMLAQYGESRGYCATGVSRTFAMAYGLDLHGNGCDWDTNMDNLVEQGAFEEVTGDYATSADLANLPAGAVVCWEATGGSSGGARYGHVTIADGQGGEISDHYASSIYKTIGGRSDQYRVYIPVC